MRITASIFAAMITLMGVSSAFAADDFATLKGVKAAPMTSDELAAVKGMHVHFLDAHGGFHLAGNPENEGVGIGNWYLNGSPDGELVAPSYHGLCVAGPIAIPPFDANGNMTAPQCP
jgi:hypothetical protein